MRRATRAGIVIVIVLALCIAARSAILWSLRESATICLPDDAGKVTFIRERQEVISFVDVAYDRQIIHRRTGQQTRSWRFPVDAGYNMTVNVYWICDGEKSFVRLDDAEGEYLLDPASNTLYLIVAVRGVQYAGPMDNGDTSVAAWGSADGRQEPWTVHIGKNQAIPLATMLSDPKGTYMGNICNISHEWRFTPARDAPEIPIKKRFADRWHLPEQAEPLL